MNVKIKTYNDKQTPDGKAIATCSLRLLIMLTAADSKIWHAHPVWFLDSNPIVGYSKQKTGWRSIFWSGADFEEDSLNIRDDKFRLTG